MKLPNSRLTITYSVDYYEFVKKGENEIRPDHQVPPTSWEDFKAGRDPAFEWIITQPLEPTSSR